MLVSFWNAFSSSKYKKPHTAKGINNMKSHLLYRNLSPISFDKEFEKQFHQKSNSVGQQLVRFSISFYVPLTPPMLYFPKMVNWAGFMI